MGVLLFQDLAVIPFLILIITSSNQDMVVSRELLRALAKGVVVVVLMFAAGHWLLRPLFHEIQASSRSSELFTLTALLMALAAAWITHYAGLSLALGAFLAGMMLGESWISGMGAGEADIRPFRDVLLGLFFITIGMLLELGVLPGILHWALLLLGRHHSLQTAGGRRARPG